ncbi:glycosyltransferase family 4 protein [Poseidonibacter lekithochrous]|uniref:glycosyltransferase family 4 protein n=1 Tax=Poseidonibacter lekithochrous TaxID=1904463 RepID=UPI000D3D5FE2|nr:glycosyltransferase family 4 protein [Poseidonibacter lekithochrous]
MKIVNISTNDFNGGAARATYRLHREFINLGHDSKLLVLQKNLDDNTVFTVNSNRFARFVSKYTGAIDNIPTRFLNITNTWSTGWYGQDISNIDIVKEADIIVLYWVSAGFLSPKSIFQLSKLNKPIFWRLSDMWPFTGGCHYSNGCDKYMNNCGSCPELKSNKDSDLSRKLINKKNKLWKNLDINIIAPSTWIADCAYKSTIFRNKKIKVLGTGVDTKIFKKIEKNIARDILNLPKDKKIILLGAVDISNDTRKGGQLAYEALNKLFDVNLNETCLVVFGSSINVFKNLNIDVNMLGKINDEYTLALLYSAADVFIAPSKEENLANTVLESASCGTPIVSFNIGGMPDIIKHKKNGYLSKPFDTNDLAYGIEWVLNSKNYDELCNNARKSILDKFDSSNISKKYIELYKGTFDE